MIYESPFETPTYPSQTLYDYLVGQISFDDPHLLLKEIEGKKRELTLGQLKTQAHQLGISLLEKHGLKSGDVVMLNAPNSIDWAIAFLATQFVGLKTALANPAYIEKELSHVVSLTEPKVILTTSAQSSSFKSAGLPLSNLTFIDSISSNLTKSSQESYKMTAPFKPSSLDETAYIAFSSGTTGLPKGVELTHNNATSMCSNLLAIPDAFFSGQSVINFLPLYHAYALVVNFFIPTRLKGTTYLISFNPDLFCQTVEKYQIQIAALVPPAVIGLSKHPAATKQSLKSLRFVGCGAAPLDAESSKNFTEKTGVEVRQGHGMTETTVGAIGLHGNQRAGTIGKPLPGVKARLVDPETGKDVSKGERGELWIKARNVFKGYYRNQQATKDTVTRDGWLKTGDIAIEEDGSFSIVDRLKELIKYKGFQVAPAELEGLLNTHPKVSVSGVIGVYSKDEGTELPRAYVQVAPGVKDDKVSLGKELSDFVAERVSSAKKLRGGVKFLDVIPISPSGKVLRKEMRLLVEKDRESKL